MSQFIEIHEVKSWGIRAGDPMEVEPRLINVAHIIAVRPGSMGCEIHTTGDQFEAAEEYTSVCEKIGYARECQVERRV